MVTGGCVLLADNDKSHREAALEACRRAGYGCDEAGSVDDTVNLLRRKHYDLLIASLAIRGNFGLRIVHEARNVAPGLPIIVTTESPSIDTAIEAIELSVAAYLTKPVDSEILLRRVSQVIQGRPAYRSLALVIGVLQQCVEDLKDLRSHWATRKDQGVPAMTVRDLSACVAELLSLGNGQPDSVKGATVCERIGCPNWEPHEAAFSDVIRVLQETKRRFKSKELAELRERIDCHLCGAGK